MANLTLSPSIYARRSGPMLFWRIGRIGGSVYLASNTTSQEEKQARKEAKRIRNEELRAKARSASFWHRAWAAEAARNRTSRFAQEA